MNIHDIVAATAPGRKSAPVYIRVGDEFVAIDKMEPLADVYGNELIPAKPLALERPLVYTRKQALEYLRDNCENEVPAEIVALLTA